MPFRCHELRAAAEASGVRLAFDESTHHPDNHLLWIRVPDEASVVRLAARAVLLKGVLEVWGHGESWDDMADALLAYPRDLAAPYLAEGTTFKVTVHSQGGRKMNDDERLTLIKRCEPLLPWKGKVRMREPDHNFVVIVDQRGEQPRHYFFGRLIAEGRRDLVGKYDLKKRNYIGTTSLDAELSLLMANLARVKPNDLVYDPYCGTAGTLVAAAAFGARCLGCDLHLPCLRGELRTRSGPSRLKHAHVDQGIPQTFAQYGLPAYLDSIHGDSGIHLNCLRLHRHSGGDGGGQGGGPVGLFDAIISDPPYGIREKPAEIADERFISRTLPEEMMGHHIPKKALAALETILSDLFDLSRRGLVDGGRLVFLLPTTARFEPSLLPEHPGLLFEGASEQLMAARWSRWVVVMRRVYDEQKQPNTTNPTPRLYYHDGSFADVSVDGRAGDAVSAASQELFNRASLRPDDIANRASPEAATVSAMAENVLHPKLLGKSAGARRRLEKRLAKAAGDGTNAADADDTSARSARRRARNGGRGEYERGVRERLGDVVSSASSSEGLWYHVAAGVLIAMASAFVVRAVARRG